MSALRFGTAGIPVSSKVRASEAGIERVAALGLGCMELEFVRSVQMKEAKACVVREVADKLGVQLTVHAPYYVNLNSREAAKIGASKERILKAARIGAAAGAHSVTFHAAFYHDDSHAAVMKNVQTHLQQIRQILDDEGNNIHLRPETTGGPSQFGTIAEILELGQTIPGVYPCIDFSHLFARSLGKLASYDEFCAVLASVQDKLGRSALSSLHMHLSGIDYGAKGEKKHLILAESEMPYQAVIQALVEFDVGGWLICESPNLEEDALIMQNYYQQIKKD